MTINSKVSVTDYNAIQNYISAVMGTGGFVPGTSTVDPSYGYGQSLSSSQLTLGTKVKASDWAKLVTDINNINRHQLGTVLTLFTTGEGQFISSTGGSANITASISGNTLDVTNVANASTTGMIVPGMIVSGTGVASGTTIVSLLSGSPWGASTWQLNNTQSVSSRSMTASSSVDYPKTNYLNAVTSLSTAPNRFRIDLVSHAQTQLKASGSQSFPGSLGAAWASLLTVNVTVTFTSAAKARYFFNSGGEIRFAPSRAGGTISNQNTSWSNILSSATAAVPAFGGNKPGTGLSPLDGQNFYRLTSSFSGSPWYSISGSSPYGSNVFRIYARCPGVANNSTGTATSIEFKIEFVDNYTDPGPPAPGDSIDGTFQIDITTLEAIGALLPLPLGNWSIESPTVSFATWSKS
jgi:hypothetical protein